jgi:hypothetical protein
VHGICVGGVRHAAAVVAVVGLAGLGDRGVERVAVDARLRDAAPRQESSSAAGPRLIGSHGGQPQFTPW